MVNDRKNSVEIIEFYSHKYLTKIAWNQRCHYESYCKLISRNIFKWEQILVFLSLCIIKAWFFPCNCFHDIFLLLQCCSGLLLIDFSAKMLEPYICHLVMNGGKCNFFMFLFSKSLFLCWNSAEIQINLILYLILLRLTKFDKITLF